MHAASRTARRFGVSATAALSLILAAATPALAGDTAPADTTPPVISSTSLTDGQTVPRQPVLHPIVTDDVGLYLVGVSIAGKTFAHCTIDSAQNVTCPLTIPTGYNGTDIDLTVRAFDKAGNHAELTTRVHVVSLVLSGTLSPPAKTAMRSGPASVTLTDVSADTATIDMIDGPDGAVLATATAAPWTFTWNATETATPPCFRLSEPFGNTTTYCSNYVVSDQPSVITSVTAFGLIIGDFHWWSELEGGNGWVGTDAEISATVTDKAGIDHAELWADGVLQGTSTLSQPWFTWHDATRGKTSANVEIRVVDRVGLTTTKAFRLNIDNAAPVLKVSPGNRTLVRGKQLTVTWTATDRNRILLPSSPLPGSQLITSPAVWQYTVALHKDGPVSTGYVAVDEYGNRTYIDSTVIVDNTAPSVAFAKAPKDNATLKSSVQFTAAAGDTNGIGKLQLVVNGSVIATSTDPHHTFTLNPTKYGKRFTVAFRAYDKAGNQRDSSKRTYHRG